MSRGKGGIRLRDRVPAKDRRASSHLLWLWARKPNTRIAIGIGQDSFEGEFCES